MSIVIPVITAVQKSSTTTAVATTAKTTVATTAKVVVTTTSSSTAKVTSTTSSSLVRTTSTTSSATTTSLKPTTTITSSTTSPTHPTTSSTTTSIHSSSSTSSSTSSSASSSSSVGLNDANAGSKSNSSNRLSTGVIAGIVGGGIVVLLLIAIISTRVIRRKRRNTRRRASGLQAWTDRRTTLHGNDDDFFDPTVGAGVGAGVASSGVAEKSWGMEMTPSREKLENYPSTNIYDRGDQDVTSAHSAQLFYPQPQQPYQPTPGPSATQWTQYPQPIADPYGLAAPAQQGYAQVSRSPSPGPIHEQYAYGVPAIVTHLPESVEQAQAEAPAAGGGVEHDPQLKDDMWVIARTSFVRSLNDELVIQPNDRLYLIQAYDDGWCLCENTKRQRGFVPLYCLQPAGAQNNTLTPQPTLALHPPSPTSPLSPALMSPGIVGEGQMETLRFIQPVVLVNGQTQQGSVVSMPDPSAGGNALPRSDTSNSLGAKSERSQRRSSLFVDANTAGMYLTHQSALGL